MSDRRLGIWLRGRNLVFILFLLLGIVFLSYQIVLKTPIWNPKSVPSSLVNYMPTDKSFFINHPENWVAVELLHGDHGDLEVIAFIGLPGKSLPSTKIARKVFANQVFLEDVVQWGIDRASKCPVYIPGTRTEINRSGFNGVRIHYECTRKTNIFFIKKETKLKCFDDYILANSTGFDVTFCAERDQWVEVEELFEQMSDSFFLR